MILTVDIGNSFTRVGIFKGAKLLRIFKEKTASVRSPKYILKRINKSYLSRISGAGISSVVTGTGQVWEKYINSEMALKPLRISGKSAIPLRLRFRSQARTGPDRICDAVAGFKHFKTHQNVIVIDAGTATTIDIVLKNGDYIGGMIAPGIGASARSLHNSTSRLPLLDHKDLIFPDILVGTDTIGALKSGIMYGALDSAEGMIRRIEKIMKMSFKVVLTGGFGKVLHDKMARKTYYDDNLVLKGIYHIVKYNIHV